MKTFYHSILSALVLLSSACTEAQQEPAKTVSSKISDSNAIVIGEKFRMYSNVLGEEKEIYVSLPPNYDESTHDYPVVFVLEAEFLFEPARSITDLLTKRSEMPASIVIGITNGGPEKRHEMTLHPHGGRVDDHLDFFKKELIPHIEKNYRANSHRTIVGLSPTTGLVLEAFWSQPDLFTGHVSLTTHLLWNPEKGISMIDKLIQTIEDPTHPKSVIYLNTADSDVMRNTTSQEEYNEAVKRLERIQPGNVSFKLDIPKNEEHYASAIIGLRKAFQLIYPLNKTSFTAYRNSEDVLGDFKKHYEALSKAYGFDVYPIDFGDPHSDSITGFAKYLSRFYKTNQAIDLLKLGLEYHPNSASIHMKLAEVYHKAGETALSIATSKKAIELADTYHSDELEEYRERAAAIGK